MALRCARPAVARCSSHPTWLLQLVLVHLVGKAGGSQSPYPVAAIMCHKHPRGTAGLVHERTGESPSAMAAAGAGSNASQRPTLAQTPCSRKGVGTASTVRHACTSTVASTTSAANRTYVFLLGKAYSGTSASPHVCATHATHATHATDVRAPLGMFRIDRCGDRRKSEAPCVHMHAA